MLHWHNDCFIVDDFGLHSWIVADFELYCKCTKLSLWAWLHHSSNYNTSAKNTSVKGSVKAAFPSIFVLAPLGGQGRGNLSFSNKERAPSV